MINSGTSAMTETMTPAATLSPRARPGCRALGSFEPTGIDQLSRALEPSTEAYAMPPGASFEVRTRAPAGEIVVESTDDGLIVRPGGDVEPILLVDGVEALEDLEYVWPKLPVRKLPLHGEA